MKDFSGKVAAITGAGSGMGRALAISLATQGCHVAISDVDTNNILETESLIKSDVKVTCHTVDVANKLGVRNYANAVEQQHGKVNMIFNNAGVSVTDTVEHMSLEDFE